jgi:DNA recombination protein RmuC
MAAVGMAVLFFVMARNLLCCAPSVKESLMPALFALLPYGFCILLSVGMFVLWRKLMVAQTLDAAHQVAEAKAQQLLEENGRLREQLGDAERQMDTLRASMFDLEKREALALQKVEATETRLREFDEAKKQFEQYAKSAALSTANELSNKLLSDHQRAREETHKQFEQFTKLATDQLTQKQQELASTLGKVQGQVDASTNQLSVLVRAMQNPIGAGAEGEIVMNNILQQHGFTPGVDYELQVHLASDEGVLRPDCVIYLPNQHAIIVDSKASQHVFALFRTEGTPEFDAAFRDIQKTMREHAKALGGKTYQESLRKLKNRNDQPISRTTLVMFIPNDEVVTRLMQKDPNLMQYMRDHNIVLSGPATLSGLFLTARALINEARQVDAQAEIMELTRELMADFITSLGYADDVMKGITNSAKAYDKFGGSLRNALSKMRKLNTKGVAPAKNKQIPSGLARYSIHKEDDVLQLEAEEPATVLSIKGDVA